MIHLNGIKDAGLYYKCFSILIRHLASKNFNPMLNLLPIKKLEKYLVLLECGLIYKDYIY